MTANGPYRIGELAARTGLTRDTLRYYERRGLILPPKRSAGGYRVYSPSVLERLRFITQAQSVGLTLAEIGDLASYQKGGRARCRRVHDLLAARLTDLEAKLAALHELERSLRRYLQECERALAVQAEPECPVVAELERGTK